MSASIRRYEFEAEDSEDEDETELVFRVVDSYENDYDDKKAAVETPAPWDVPDGATPPNDLVKSLEWVDHHYTFDKDRRAWTLDISGLKPLAEKAEDAGYEWKGVADRRHRLENGGDEGDEGDDELEALCGAASEGDTVRVQYEKKNGNGLNTYEGEVESAQVAGERTGRGVRAQTTGIVFWDSDGKTKRVKADDNGTPALFSSGYYPFMGELVEVELER